jgi:hypothetical protein
MANNEVETFPYQVEIGIKQGERSPGAWFVVGNFRNIESARKRADDHNGPIRITRRMLIETRGEV